MVKALTVINVTCMIVFKLEDLVLQKTVHQLGIPSPGGETGLTQPISIWTGKSPYQKVSAISFRPMTSIDHSG